jgi:hypothetical protein
MKCRHVENTHSRYDAHPMGYFCGHPKFKKIDFVKGTNTGYGDCEILNKNGKCELYEEKLNFWKRLFGRRR